jgi:hypothetical protein
MNRQHLKAFSSADLRKLVALTMDYEPEEKAAWMRGVLGEAVSCSA